LKKIIFLCAGHSRGSQMAEEFACSMLLNEHSVIDSAGLRAENLNNFAVKVMKETGIDISGQKSKNISAINVNCFDSIVTIHDHAQNTCSTVQNKKSIHKNIIDPALASETIDQQLVVYRKVSDEIRLVVVGVLKKYDNICQEQN